MSDGTISGVAAGRFDKRRLARLDMARGLALVAMAIYHFTWDLEFFGYLDAGTASQGGWKLFARAIASSFLFLAGFSLVLGHHPAIRWRAFARRFAMIVAAAALITIATYVATPDRFIFFGILHSIAMASLIGLAFLRLPPVVTLVAGCLVIMAPLYLRAPVFDTPALWWMGLAPQNPPSNDYVPMFPWLAPALFGIAAARFAKASGRLTMLASDGAPSTGARALAFAGRHSLVVYLLHQPILIGIVYSVSLIAPPPAADPAVSYGRSCQASCAAEQSEGFCERYCDCTFDGLDSADLIDDLFASRLDPVNDPRARAIADQCVADILGGDGNDD